MAPSSYYHYYFTALCTFLSQHLTFTLRLRGFGEYVIKTYNGQLQKEIKRLKHIAVARLQASQGRGSLAKWPVDVVHHGDQKYNVYKIYRIF